VSNEIYGFVRGRPWLAIVGYVAALAALSGVCVLNQWVLSQLFELNYIRWYVNAGPIIGLATAAFGAAWGGMDKNTGLVSANPFDYVGACLQVAGLPIIVFGVHISSMGSLAESLGTPPRFLATDSRAYRPASREVLAVLRDALLGVPLILVFTVSTFAWLLLVAAPQYFVFLVCGAPSRIAMASSNSVYAHFSGRSVKTETKPLNDPLPEGSWDASMRDKPVTLTSAFSAAMLFVTGWLWL
jgi:hypothetical protein